MQDDTDHQADPCASAKRELSRAVDAINADILAAGEPRPKWTQEEAIAYESALECITHLRAILTGERHNDNPTPERLAEIEAEFARLLAERRALSVHDHAEIARIRRDYGQRIRADMERGRRQASIDNARGSVRFEGFILSPEVEQINRRFIDGELTRQEHVEAIKAAVKSK